MNKNDYENIYLVFLQLSYERNVFNKLSGFILHCEFLKY